MAASDLANLGLTVQSNTHAFNDFLASLPVLLLVCGQAMAKGWWLPWGSHAGHSNRSPAVAMQEPPRGCRAVGYYRGQGINEKSCNFPEPFNPY